MKKRFKFPTCYGTADGKTRCGYRGNDFKLTTINSNPVTVCPKCHHYIPTVVFDGRFPIDESPLTELDKALGVIKYGHDRIEGRYYRIGVRYKSRRFDYITRRIYRASGILYVKYNNHAHKLLAENGKLYIQLNDPLRQRYAWMPDFKPQMRLNLEY